MAKATTELKTIASNKTLTKILKLYLEKKAILDALDAEIKEHRNEIRDFLNVAGTNEALYTSETGEIFTLKESVIKRTNINKDLLETKFPEVFEACKSPVEFPRLNVTPKNKTQVQGIIEKKKQLINQTFELAV